MSTLEECELVGNVETLTYFLRFLNIRCAEMLFVRHEVAPIEAVSAGTNLELRTMFVIHLKRQHIQKYDVIKVLDQLPAERLLQNSIVWQPLLHATVAQHVKHMLVC